MSFLFDLKTLNHCILSAESAIANHPPCVSNQSQFVCCSSFAPAVIHIEAAGALPIEQSIGRCMSYARSPRQTPKYPNSPFAEAYGGVVLRDGLHGHSSHARKHFSLPLKGNLRRIGRQADFPEY